VVVPCCILGIVEISFDKNIKSIEEFVINAQNGNIGFFNFQLKLRQMLSGRFIVFVGLY
jgi:hypothetical protein